MLHWGPWKPTLRLHRDISETSRSFDEDDERIDERHPGARCLQGSIPRVGPHGAVDKCGRRHPLSAWAADRFARHLTGKRGSQCGRVHRRSFLSR
jgi:hypothetical protein